MKKISFVLVAVLLAFQNINADNWITSFEEAQKIALATDKLLLVDFWATWCGPCKRMDFESWSKDEVKLLMQNFVPVKIDIDSNKSLASNYGVRGIPFIFLMDGNGKVLYKEMSYKSKDQVLNLLTKYSISTSLFKQNLINYYKNPNFATAFQLASRYNDFSIYFNEDVRMDILNVSKDYFSDSQKLLKKSDIENKDEFEQKIEMYEIQEAIILNNTKKANKLLDKIKEESLSSINKSFFYFLKYLTCKKMEDETQAIFYDKKLSEKDKLKVITFLKAI